MRGKGKAIEITTESQVFIVIYFESFYIFKN